MKKTLLALATAALLATPAIADDTQGRLESSRAASQQLFEVLRDEMQAAVQSGGPVAAVDVCHEKAQALTKKIADERGWRIARTAQKVRNAQNAPDAWEAKVLEEFQKRKANGESLENMELSAVVEEDGKKVFRYMKAIPMGGVCANCHGPVLKPNVIKRIDQYYPKDKARGFQVGDLRGAFTISQPM